MASVLHTSFWAVYDTMFSVGVINIIKYADESHYMFEEVFQYKERINSKLIDYGFKTTEDHYTYVTF